MLRLMGDMLSAIPGYALVAQNTSNPSEEKKDEEEEGEEPKDYSSALRELLDWLDDLDQAWLAILQSQVWDPDNGEGVDLVLTTTNGNSNGQTLTSTSISQTDVTRLRSLLVTGIASLEEWLSRTRSSATSSGSVIGGEEDVTGMLERLGLMDEFDELFSRTMDFLGGFGGGFASQPGDEVDMDGTWEEEDEVEQG
jgi:hypothetical protein